MKPRNQNSTSEDETQIVSRRIQRLSFHLSPIGRSLHESNQLGMMPCARTKVEVNKEKLSLYMRGKHREIQEKVFAYFKSRPELQTPVEISRNEHRELCWRQLLGLVREAGIRPLKYISEDPAIYFAILEAAGSVDISLGIKMGVQYSLWGGSIINIGTKKHRDKYFDGIDNLDYPGCFAMTELHHGSNVQGLQTIATFDPLTDEFVINTPHDGAIKWWIGNAAVHGKFATSNLKATAFDGCLGSSITEKKCPASLVAEKHGFSLITTTSEVLVVIQMAADLLKQYKEKFQGGTLAVTWNYLKESMHTYLSQPNPVTARWEGEEHLRDPKFQLDAFRYRTSRLLQSVAVRLRKHSKTLGSFGAWNRCLNHLLTLAESHIESVILAKFIEAVQNCPDPSSRAALKLVCDLYALDRIWSDIGTYRNVDYVAPNKAKAIHKLTEYLCFQVRNIARELIDAFDLPDHVTRAPIAMNSDAYGQYTHYVGF
eukprot:XP_015583267.1 acyl-coenzyme A oxidase 2, peroxisomal [Ricinus communis]